MRFAALFGAVLALAITPSLARANPGAAGEFSGLLRPGSRLDLGLGGDPFRSPLDDQCGWWGNPGFTAVSGVRTWSRASEPVSPNAGGGSRLSTGEVSWRIDGVRRFADRTIWFSGGMSQPRWNGALDLPDGGVQLVGDRTRTVAALRIGDLLPGLDAQATTPLWNESGMPGSADAGAGLRYRPMRGLRAQASWSLARLPEILESDIYEQALSAPINLRSHRMNADVRIGPVRRLDLEASIGRSRFNPDTPRSDAFQYQIEPAGRTEVDQVSLEWAARRGLRLLARGTRDALDIESDVSWGGERFGRLDYAKAELRSMLIAMDARLPSGGRIVLDVERVSAKARARGTLETWPFTSTELDLLGLRFLGRAEGRARWDRVHTGIERPLGGAGRFALGVNGYDMHIDGFIETWRPLFLVFGRTDVQTVRPGFDRAQLAALSLGWSRPIAGLELGVALEQFVFAKTYGSPAGDDAPEIESAPPAPGRPEAKRGWPGGTSLEIHIGHRF